MFRIFFYHGKIYFACTLLRMLTIFIPIWCEYVSVCMYDRRRDWQKKLEIQIKTWQRVHMHIFCVCLCVGLCVLVYELIILKKFHNKLINHKNRNHCALYAWRSVLGREGELLVLVERSKKEAREVCWIAYCLCMCVWVFVSVLSPPVGEVSALSYSLLLDLIAAAGLSLRDLDLGREIAPNVVVGGLVAIADAVGQ